jgi:hypothetical protein
LKKRCHVGTVKLTDQRKKKKSERFRRVAGMIKDDCMQKMQPISKTSTR